MGSAPTVEAPKPRDLGQETRDTLQAQVDLAPEIYGAEAEFKPKYTDLDNQILERSLLGTDSQRGILDIYEKDIDPFVRRQQELDAAMSNRLLADQRARDIQDVETLGMRANEAFRKANPLIDELTTQAQEDIRLRGALSPQEQREVEQQTRAAYADRGLVRGNRAIGEELLNRDSYKRQKMFQDRDFAMRVAATQADPFMAILGRSGRQIDSGAGAGLAAQAQGQGAGGNTMFGMNQAQYAQYSQGLNEDNFAQKNNFAIANANMAAAAQAQKMQLAAAGIQSVGSMAGAF